MKISLEKFPIIISTVANHTDIKNKLLMLIDEMPNNALVYNDPSIVDKISKTDWNLPNDAERKYLDFIKPVIVDTIFDSFKDLKPEGLAFTKFWFQQYSRSDTHDWHVHMRCHWTSVYFVELPDSNVKTEIQNTNRNFLIDYDAKEGDIVTFPSFLYHRSPPNFSVGRKTIISFNTNFVSKYDDVY
jgi:hypothetical protein